MGLVVQQDDTRALSRLATMGRCWMLLMVLLPCHLPHALGPPQTGRLLKDEVSRHPVDAVK